MNHPPIPFRDSAVHPHYLPPYFPEKPVHPQYMMQRPGPVYREYPPMPIPGMVRIPMPHTHRKQFRYQDYPNYPFNIPRAPKLIRPPMPHLDQMCHLQSRNAPHIQNRRPEDCNLPKRFNLTSSSVTSGFLIGGEPYLLMPQVLNFCVNGVESNRVKDFQEAADKVGYTPRFTTPEQTAALKEEKLIPDSVPKSGLIAYSYADLFIFLIEQKYRTIRDNASTTTINEDNPIQIYHECFGKTKGRLFPEQLRNTDFCPETTLSIECECGKYFSCRNFVRHVHNPDNKSWHHWGFNSKKWYRYLSVSGNSNTREAYRVLRTLVRNYLKNRHSIRRQESQQSESDDDSDSEDFSIDDDDHLDDDPHQDNISVSIIESEDVTRDATTEETEIAQVENYKVTRSLKRPHSCSPTVLSEPSILDARIPEKLTEVECKYRRISNQDFVAPPLLTPPAQADSAPLECPSLCRPVRPLSCHEAPSRDLTQSPDIELVEDPRQRQRPDSAQHAPRVRPDISPTKIPTNPDGLPTNPVDPRVSVLHRNEEYLRRIANGRIPQILPYPPQNGRHFLPNMNGYHLQNPGMHMRPPPTMPPPPLLPQPAFNQPPNGVQPATVSNQIEATLNRMERQILVQPLTVSEKQRLLSLCRNLRFLIGNLCQSYQHSNGFHEDQRHHSRKAAEEWMMRSHHEANSHRVHKDIAEYWGHVFPEYRKNAEICNRSSNQYLRNEIRKNATNLHSSENTPEISHSANRPDNGRVTNRKTGKSSRSNGRNGDYLSDSDLQFIEMRNRKLNNAKYYPELDNEKKKDEEAEKSDDRSARWTPVEVSDRKRLVETLNIISPNGVIQPYHSPPIKQEPASPPSSNSDGTLDLSNK